MGSTVYAEKVDSTHPSSLGLAPRRTDCTHDVRSIRFCTENQSNILFFRSNRTDCMSCSARTISIRGYAFVTMVTKSQSLKVLRFSTNSQSLKVLRFHFSYTYDSLRHKHPQLQLLIAHRAITTGAGQSKTDIQ
jgi:hypothetical protein